MKKLRIISFAVLIIYLFVSLDLGLNFLQAVASQISGTGDGISIYGIFARMFLGDRGWSYQSYLDIFKTSAWLTFAILAENAFLAMISLVRRER